MKRVPIRLLGAAAWAGGTLATMLVLSHGAGATWRINLTPQAELLWECVAAAPALLLGALAPIGVALPERPLHFLLVLPQCVVWGLFALFIGFVGACFHAGVPPWRF